MTDRPPDTYQGSVCEHCGYDIGNGWHDGQMVEIEVECPKCGKEIVVLSGYLSLQGWEYTGDGKSEWIDGWAWEIELGRDWIDGTPGRRRSRHIDYDLRAPQNWTEGARPKFELICPDQHRCRFRRVVGLKRTSDAMVAAWRRGAHRIVAGVDL